MNRYLLLPVFSFLVCTCGFAQEAMLYRSDYLYYKDLGSGYPEETLPNMSTVDFRYHQGHAKLEDGRTLEGWFCFAPYGKTFNFLTAQKLKHKSVVYYKKELNGDVQETIPNEDLIKLTVAGKDSTVFTHGDSTFFLRKNNMLLRLRSDKPFPFYDNLFIVDELGSKHLLFWRRLIHEYKIQKGTTSAYFTYSEARPVWGWVDISTYRQLRTSAEIFYEWQGKLEKIKKWDDVKGKFHIDPFILKVAELLDKDDPYDIGFGITFSVSENKIQLLPFFEKMSVKLKDGRELNGLGYIIPLHYRSLKEKPGYTAFYDGKNFFLFKPDEINSLNYRDRKYTPAHVKLLNWCYMSYPWEYKGIKYQVAEGFINDNKKGFFDQEGVPSYVILTMKKSGIYGYEGSDKLEEELLKGIR